MQADRATQRLARELALAPDLEGFFAANRHRFAPETMADLKREVDRLVEVDLTKAEPLAMATQRLASLLEDPISLGYGDAAVARVHHYAGRLPDAELHYRAAIERLGAAGLRGDTAAVQVQFVALLMRQGRADDALALARRVRPALRRTRDRHLLAQLENNVGTVYTFVLERHRSALPYFDRARALFDEIGDMRALAFAEYNRANVLRELDQPHATIDVYERAERLLIEHHARRAAAVVAYSAAITHTILGRYGDALKRFHAARELSQGLGDAVQVAMTELAMAELFLRINIADQANDLAAKAIELFRSIPGHDAEVARALSVSARVLARQGDAVGAARELLEAEAIYERTGALILAADVRLERAWLANASGDAESARALADDAARAYARGRLRVRRAWALLALASAEGLLGRPGVGLRAARAALRTGEQFNEPWLLCRAQEVIGGLEIERGRGDAGVAALERAVDGIERLRLSIRSGETRAAFLGDKLGPYERLVTMHLKRDDPASARAAFRYVEMAKSRALADLMGQYLNAPRETPALGDRPQLREQLARRLEEMSWYSARIAREGEKGEQRNSRLDAHLRVELERCELELSKLYLRLEAEDGEFARLFGADTADTDEIACELAADEALVEFFIADNVISAFVVTRDGIRAVPAVAELSHVERLLAALRYQLEKFGLGSRYARMHATALRRCADRYLEELYAALLTPIADAIAGRRLVVVPHGILHYVPIHALKAPDGKYVIETNEVSYCPSATVYRLCATRASDRTPDRGLLAVGLADANAPHIGEELAALGGLFPDSVLLEGGRADKAAFLELAPRARYVHLATHGHFRQDNPMFSSVRLADSPLNFYDVFDLGMGAELVTLSACNTGVSGVAPGDELCGLMRGFLHAGTPSMVVSLWAVHDRSTSELMQSFYKNLRSGLGKRAALREAQLEVLCAYGHPYYWAPFVLMGKA